MAIYIQFCDSQIQVASVIKAAKSLNQKSDVNSSQILALIVSQGQKYSRDIISWTSQRINSESSQSQVAQDCWAHTFFCYTELQPLIQLH